MVLPKQIHQRSATHYTTVNEESGIELAIKRDYSNKSFWPH